MKTLFCICITSLILSSAYSNPLNKELLKDIKAYCQYVEAKNKARTSILLSPDVIVRAQNSTSDYPYQNNVITALSKDLSDFGKSKQIRMLIHEECQYYALNQEANLQVQYAISTIQNQALNYKLRKIQAARKKLHSLLTQIKQKVRNHNETLIHLYKLDLMLQKLDEAERDIRVNLVLQQSISINKTNLKRLVQRIQVAERRRQSTLNQLEKLNNWSLQVQAGAQQNDSSFIHNQSVQPYGAVFIRYNMGSVSSNHKIDQSLDEYTKWKNKKVDGILKKLARLRESISALKVVQQQRLNRIKASYHQYKGLTRRLQTIDSPTASHFKQQIDTDLILKDIEISYLNYFIERLRSIE